MPIPVVFVPHMYVYLKSLWKVVKGRVSDLVAEIDAAQDKH